MRRLYTPLTLCLVALLVAPAALAQQRSAALQADVEAAIAEAAIAEAGGAPGGGLAEAVTATLTEEAKLIASDGVADSQFGTSVSLFRDRALIGARGDNDNDNGSDAGAAYVFAFDGSSWSQEQKLTASDGSSGDYFGWSVSLSGDRALIGALFDDDNGFASGSAYVFAFDGSSWSQEQKLTASDGSSGDYFGWSVSLSGDRALIGGIRDRGNGFNSGSAYVFAFDGSSWSEQQKLAASDGSSDEYFGTSVSLSGDRALIGADVDDDNGINSGSAYVFAFDGSSWSEQQKLIASDGGDGDVFGTSVSLSGDRALIGARRDGNEGNGSDAGSAYVFAFDGSSWSEQQKLTASDGFSGDFFGTSVSLSGDRALIGAVGDDDAGPSSGSAYVFVFDGSSWSEQQKLTASDGSSGASFGISVSLSGDRALIGAYGDGSFSGSAYAFAPTYDLTAVNTTPGGAPIVVAQGDLLAFDYTVTNNADDPAAGDLFFTVASGGTIVAQGEIRRGTVAPDQTVSPSFVQTVPPGAPVGSYNYTLQIRLSPDLEVVDEEVFEIEVTEAGTQRRRGSTLWTVLEAEAWGEGFSSARAPEGAVSPPEVRATAFGLRGTYPNPVSGRATVAFGMTESARVTLAVYDVLGREVARLVDGEVEAGRHEVVLDGSDLPSGVYLVRLAAGGVVQTERVTLLR